MGKCEDCRYRLSGGDMSSPSCNYLGSIWDEGRSQNKYNDSWDWFDEKKKKEYENLLKSGAKDYDDFSRNVEGKCEFFKSGIYYGRYKYLKEMTFFDRITNFLFGF